MYEDSAASIDVLLNFIVDNSVAGLLQNTPA